MRESIVVDRVAIAELVSDKMASSIMALVSSYKYVIVSEADSHTRILRNIPVLKEKYISPPWPEWNSMLAAVEEDGLINRLMATNAWAQYSSQHQIGVDSAERTCMLFMLARWYDADIICSYPRWKVLAEFLQSSGVAIAKGVSASRKVKLPRFTTEPTEFPLNSSVAFSSPGLQKLAKPFEYNFISMLDPEEGDSFLAKSWRENLAALIGPRRTAGLIAVVGLSAFALGMYKYSDLILSWANWVARLFG
jgi:hypothetical protein